MRKIIETERLYLREFLPSDGFHFYYLNKDEEVLKFTGDVPFTSLKAANRFILEYAEYKTHGYGRWAVCDKISDEFLGWCGLKYDPEYGVPDLGFRFYRKYWGNNYATEAALACVFYGFNELSVQRIIGRAYKENKGSIRVLEKCNFKYLSTIKYDNRNTRLYHIKNDRN